MSGLTWKLTDHDRIVGQHLPSSQGDLGLMGPHWWPAERKQLWDLLQLLTSGSPGLLLLSCFSSPQKWHFLCPRPPSVFSAWPAEPSQRARSPPLRKVVTSVRGLGGCCPQEHVVCFLVSGQLPTFPQMPLPVWSASLSPPISLRSMSCGEQSAQLPWSAVHPESCASLCLCVWWL